MFNAFNPRAASAYQRINVETSMHTIDQHQLVSLLFDGVLGSVALARGAMERGDILTKCNAIGKAIRIIEEGLSTALDRDDGGEIAHNLGALYDYALMRLIAANLRNDPKILLEVQHIFEPIAQGWNEMKKNGATPAAAPTNADRPTLHEA